MRGSERRREPSSIPKKTGQRPERKKEMNKYEVWVTVWSNEYKKQIKVVAGEFDKYFNAKLFADAYSKYYHATTEIVEYTRK